MNAQNNHKVAHSVASTSRRAFLKQTSGALAGATLASAMATGAHAAEDNTIRIGLIGCGGRGTGAAVQALSTEGPTKLVAMADVFSDRLERSFNSLKANPALADQLDVPEDRKFLGMDGYQKVIDAVGPGGVVLLTTPPAFRPLHLEHAVANDCHVFMEKSFAVDGPGVRRVLEAGQQASRKNLKVAGGLMSRHSIPLKNAVQQIHDGKIGKVITCWAYREHQPVGFQKKRPGENELQHQIRNYSCFTWLNGSFILDWLIHNLDVCCWVKDAWPVSAQGQGGREVRTQPDQLFDHYAVEYRFADGTRLFAQGRHIGGCWNFFGDIIHGATGSAILGEGQPDPRLYQTHDQTKDNLIWQFDKKTKSQYQIEHDLLFDAIRRDVPYNETERCAYAALTGILGRMAAESGIEISWEEALNSDLQLAPNLDEMTMQSEAPVQPDADGDYPVAVPGETQVL
jgi:predicted dehydrogenase